MKRRGRKAPRALCVWCECWRSCRFHTIAIDGVVHVLALDDACHADLRAWMTETGREQPEVKT